MSAEVHKLYLDAPDEHKWRRGNLAALLMTLRRQALAREEDAAARKAEKDWSWYVLPGGAVVAYRIRHDYDRRGEIRISRKEKPSTPAVEAKWEAEVRTFLKHFEIRHGDGNTPSPTPGQVWFRQEPSEVDKKKGGAVARYIELRMGEIRPDRAFCAICGGETEWWPAGGLTGQRCRDHLGDDPIEGRDR